MSPTHQNVLLFDVDGVLVYDRGYRAAIAATLSDCGRRLGLSGPLIDDDAIEAFHARGYTNEWDLCPLALGVLIIEALRARPDQPLSAAPPIEFLSQIQGDLRAPWSYEPYLADTTLVSGRPTQRALAALLHQLDQLRWPERTHTVVAGVLRELLADPYDVPRAPLTQLFQEFALGSAVFEETYQLRPRFDVPSLLAAEDRAALDTAHRDRLAEWAQADRARTCVYTARPSLPPADDRTWLEAQPRPLGYSPEAELAVQLCGLQNYPLIATGRMLWLARRVQQPVESFTKPAPVQALAALAAALTTREADSLTAAYDLVAQGRVTAPFEALAGTVIDLYVFEDATLGLQAAQGAVAALRHIHVDVRLHGIGISPGGPKAQALRPLCEAIVPDVNAAIDLIAPAITG